MFLILAVTLAPVAVHGQDRDEEHDRGNHGDRDKHGDHDNQGDRDEHHDNGLHKGWYKHHDDDYRDWDYDHDRIKPGRHYPHGRYGYVKHRWIARSFDIRSRQIILEDDSEWIVSSYDRDRCRDWRWDNDDVYVYDDDHHAGWYLLFNSRLGRYVHVEYYGGQ